ncbi:hypothetical protein HK098_002691 [Nowakowskiella sp. JEL0407]|nr:hypothetical protein HK098_002691 [Nowakowskiella sp. JEL0407]
MSFLSSTSTRSKRIKPNFINGDEILSGLKSPTAAAISQVDVGNLGKDSDSPHWPHWAQSGGSIAGAIVIIAIVLGAVFFIRRHNTAKNEAYRTLEPTALIGTEDQVVEIASDQTEGKEDNFVEIM